VEEVARRLRRAGLRGQVVHLKFRTADFTTVTRQETLPAPADTTDAIWPVAERLLAKADDGTQAIRLIGVSLSLFDGERQMPLFEPPNVERGRRVARAVDTLVERFGPTSSPAAMRRANDTEKETLTRRHGDAETVANPPWLRDS
jgi:DNA polymerase-4